MDNLPLARALGPDLDGLDSARFTIFPGLDLVVWRAAGSVTVFYELEESGEEVDQRLAARTRGETRLALTFGVA